MVSPGADFDPSLLTHELDGRLLRALAEFPRVVASAAELREPHRVARYLEDTAAVFNRWYDTKECRMLPMGDEPVTPTNEARLVLVAVRPDRARQRPRPARRLGPREDVIGRAHRTPVRLGPRGRRAARPALAA